MKSKRRMTTRRYSDTNGHWFDISAGEIVDARFKPWRSISRRAFSVLILCSLALFALMGWLLSIQIDSEVNPRKIAKELEPSVFQVFCGNYSGTAFAIENKILSGYETTLVSAAHLFEDCEIGDNLELRGRDGEFRAVLAARTTSALYDSRPDLINDIALLGARFSSPGLRVASTIQKGDWAIAIGYPWQQEQYLSFGVVADQNVTEVFVDTPLNEGNSGGPIVNGRGEVIGVASYYPLREDLYDGNEDGILDRADGIAALKKMSNLCSLPRSVVRVCPFPN